jgi:predicted type IV restriction endonuclease
VLSGGVKLESFVLYGLMELREHILHIQENIRAGLFANEASVSQGIVLRVLQALGWPIFDSRVVSPEYGVEGRRVDFALCHPPDKPMIFIEVKQIGHSEGADKQLFEYAFHLGVPMAVLTDGQEWHFYLPGEQGLYQERRVYKLDLLERNIEECEARLKRYLDYQASCSGKALEEARRDYQGVAKDRQITVTLPLAWAKLTEEPDDLLIELVADKVESLCGYKPDPDTVASFLTNGTRSAVISSNKSISSAPPKAQKPLPVPKEQPKLSSAGFRLQGHNYVAKNARDVMIQIFEELARRDSTFLERFAARPKHGKKRRFIARSQMELYPDRPDLGEAHSYRLSSGWWIGTNYSRENIEKIVKMACEVAGLRYGTDVVIKLE